MWQAKKALDLQADPRFAIHSGSDDPPGWRADAKMAGRMKEVTDPASGAGHGDADRSHRFRADITELVVVRLGDPADHLVIESWHEGHGLRSARR